MKHSTDVALMLGVKEPADNLLVYSKARGKFRARNSGLKHGIAQVRFRGKKRIEGNEGITIRVREFREAKGRFLKSFLQKAVNELVK
jgi:hypothetical protein